MRKLLVGIAGLAAVCLLLPLRGGGEVASETDPRYTSDGQMLRPGNYREWVFLSSGLGMTYGPIQSAARDREPLFDNVFASPAAYKHFLGTGKWPDKTVLVLEIRSSQSKASINNGGHFQSDALAMEVHVKDEARFPGKWAFFPFGKDASTAKPFPITADCYSCHAEHAAVDTTFVQFYPTLLSVARAKGTLK